MGTDGEIGGQGTARGNLTHSAHSLGSTSSDAEVFEDEAAAGEAAARQVGDDEAIAKEEDAGGAAND